MLAAAKSNTAVANVLSNMFVAGSAEDTWYLEQCIAVDTNGYIFLCRDGFTSIDDLASLFAQTPLQVEAILSAPIETALTAEEIDAYALLFTHEPTTTIYNDEGAWMEVGYVNTGNYDADAILFRKQNLSDERQAQARENIGAAEAEHMHEIADVNGLQDALDNMGGLPEVTTEDNGKFMRVVDGVWAAVAITNADEVSY